MSKAIIKYGNNAVGVGGSPLAINNLVPENVKSGVNIGGVVGTYALSEADIAPYIMGTMEVLNNSLVPTIKSYYCQSNSNLKEVVLPICTNIFTGAFQNCDNVEKIELVGGVSIADKNFNQVYNVKTLKLKINGMLYSTTFENLHNVENFVFDKESNISQIGGRNFCYLGANKQSHDLFVFDMRKCTYTSIGQDFLRGSNAYRTRSLNVYMPSTLTSISTSSFLSYSTNCNIFFSSQTPPSISSNTMGYGTGLKIFVPYQKINAYKTATYWASKGTIYGWAEENTFQNGDTLPSTNAEGLSLTWYSDIALTQVVTSVSDSTQIYYCVAGS